MAGKNSAYPLQVAAKSVLGAHTDHANATMQAHHAVYSLLQQQASLWAYLDNFFVFGVLALCGIPLVFFFQRPKYAPQKPAAPDGH